MTTILPLNKTDNIVLTKLNGITACSVQDINDTEIISTLPKNFNLNQNEKAMDLISAKQDASTKSKEVRSLVFVDVKEDGECEISQRLTKESIHAFRDGNEVAVPEYKERVKPEPKEKVVKEVKQKTKKKMATTAKKTATKKVAKKESTTGLIGKATTLLLSAADWKRIEKAVADGKGSVRELASKGILKVV